MNDCSRNILCIKQTKEMDLHLVCLRGLFLSMEIFVKSILVADFRFTFDLAELIPDYSTQANAAEIPAPN